MFYHVFKILYKSIDKGARTYISFAMKLEHATSTSNGFETFAWLKIQHQS